jgi:uncharacterized protein YjbI with pentapeptide repeats
MPFANIDVDFGAFFILGPAVLCAILMYLHILLGQWEKLGKGYDYDHRLIYIFNVPTHVARGVSNFTFYILGPAVLFGFALRARAGGALWLFVTITYAVALVLLGLYLQRREANRVKFITSSVALTTVFALFWWPGFLTRLLPVQLPGADLSKEDLSRFDLRGANAFRANLSDSDLSLMNLTGINLIGANLERADISSSVLTGAVLTFANLASADLMEASLNKADLSHSNLKNGSLGGANLKDASLIYANLDGVNLAFAHLDGAKLDGTSLVGANLSGADLSSATGLHQDQLTNACGNQDTRVPSTLVAPPNCVRGSPAR